MLLAQKSVLRRRAGAGAVLRAPGRRAAHRRRRRPPTRPRLLLEVLTPIAKSWPSEWCLEANSLAIQVHGGYGYTRDFPVEQYWRDNRLNMIHEGTHGIQAARPAGPQGGDGGRRAACSCWPTRIDATDRPREPACRRWRRTPRRWRRRCSSSAPRPRAAWATGDAAGGAGQRGALHAGLRPRRARLDLARRGAVRRRVGATTPAAAQAGSRACRYFFHYELPKIGAWLGVVERRDDTCRTMAEDWF